MAKATGDPETPMESGFQRASNIPFSSLGSLFVGREEALADLEDRRTGDGGNTAVWIQGSGGVGKTRLAIEYAFRHQQEYPSALLFVNAWEFSESQVSFSNLSSPLVLNLVEWKEGNENARHAAVIRWLNENPGWLLIFDQVESNRAAAEVQKILSELKGGVTIITSRSPELSDQIKSLKLGPLQPKFAVDFLLKCIKPNGRRAAGSLQGAAILASALGHLPFALELAGVAISKSQSKSPLFEFQQRLAEHNSSVDAVTKTWLVISGEIPFPARRLINAVAFFAVAPVPVNVLERSAELVADLESRGLLRPAAGESGFSIHDLLQEVVRKQLDDQQRNSALEDATLLVRRSLPSTTYEERTWVAWERLAPLCGSLLSHLRPHPVLEAQATDILNAYAQWLVQRAEYSQAETLLRRALSIAQNNPEPGSPKVAQALNDLASLLCLTNRHAAAEPLIRMALEIREKNYGPEHSVVANDLNILGRLLQETNRYAEAEPLFRRAIAIYEKVSGPDTLELGQSLNNLAELLRQTSRYDDAYPLYQRALEIAETKLGPDHPDVSTVLNNLGLLLCNTNRPAEAESLYRRALTIAETKLGPFHPQVATRLNNLAGLLAETDHPEDAEPLYLRALDIAEKSLGPEHPKVGLLHNNLANVYEKTGRIAEAEPRYRRAIEITIKTFGETDRRNARYLDNLARLCAELKRYAEAEQFYQRALEIDEKIYGPEHPFVLSDLERLFQVLIQQRRFPDAEALVRRALGGAQKAYGEDHPKVAELLKTLISLLKETSREGEAARLERRLVQITDKTYGQAARVRTEQAEVDFEQNLRRRFTLRCFSCEAMALFRDVVWELQPSMNVLLGRNGYGKSYLLRALCAVLQRDDEVSREMFSGDANEGSLRLDLLRDEEECEILRRKEFFETSVGKVPVLAIPDSRLINQSQVNLAPVTEKWNDLKEHGAYHFLRQLPYESTIQTFLYQLCIDYAMGSRDFESREFTLVSDVLSELTGEIFRFHSVTTPGTARFRLDVVTQSESNIPLPIQKASQGTLSVIAIFGIIYYYLRAISPELHDSEIPHRPGLVIIDEIDAHLHPIWQRRILSLLRKHFPNVQFVVTAHSPLVVAGCLEREVAVLRRDSGAGLTLSQFPHDFIGWEVGDIYKTVFDLEERDEAYNYYIALRPQKARLNEEKSDLERLTARTREEEQRLADIREKIYYITKTEQTSEKRVGEEALRAENEALRARLRTLVDDGEKPRA